MSFPVEFIEGARALGKAAEAARHAFTLAIAAAFNVPVELLEPQPGRSHYWRDGKRRRNHAWHREAARRRRRIAKYLREHP